ncbi:ABC transporter permease [Ornithinibacillus halotolerans]|uniref:Transport permease YfiN n=1 Tax=Ornithinibacillus halotolerans TaxID=1274357 RepID=A0A916S7P1_9BACI|nr:ABC transporter permease [Ornithinibacillus halotolerans]GGA85618.1 putative transport permease YfiN [Ornithinibacillus halotolerans]
MIGILIAKFKNFIRNPWTFLIFTGMSLLMAFIFGGTNAQEVYIPISTVDKQIKDSYIGEQLEKEEGINFSWMSEEQLREKIETGKAELGVVLDNNTYQIIVGIDSHNTGLVEQIISRIYYEKQEQEKILTIVGQDETVIEELNHALEQPVFEIESATFRGEGAFIYDNSLHRIFGFSLFFVIYTIAYNVLPILIEKRGGIWDRLILSPVKKSEMYIANLLFSFLTGYFQVLVIFFFFRFVIGVNFYGRFVETILLLIPYVFAIVALAILVTALVKKVQQFNAVLPILAISMAMIGGAYWPIEIVESKILLLLAKINPLTYGLEILKGITVYSYSLQELLLPISILVLMGVVMMGLGIHFMERRHI